MTSFDSVNCLEVTFPAELGSVSECRRLVSNAARDWGIATDVADDAVLAISELVTNAVLHAGTAVDVSVRRLGGGMRLEVGDGSPRLPVVGADRPEDLLETRSMTGRGLALLAATADRWGADPVATGKVMWAEIGTGRRRPVAVDSVHGASAAVTAFPGASWAGVSSLSAMTAAGRRVHLVGVPVRLLVESAKQFADLEREMQVIGLDRNGPTELMAMADTSREIAAHVGGLRLAGSDVAAAALARGESIVDFDVEVAEDAIAALDRLGQLARRVGDSFVGRHVLTLPPSDEVVAYRRWYRDEMAAQLTGRAPQPCPFAVAAAP